MSFYIGQRLSYDGALCTVRYHGTLPGAKWDWLGIEWDNPSRGKHHGTHQGQRIFQCLSSSPTAASFLRSTRKPDLPRTVIDALKHKYGAEKSVNGSVKPGIDTEAEIVHISGKAVEEVGFDKIQKQLSRFQDLKVVLLDALNVSGLTGDRSPKGRERASQEFADTCPNIIELDLGYNPIEDWQDIADICKHLKKLGILKVGGVRLKSLGLGNVANSSPFSGIEELHLNETLLRPNQILAVLSSPNRQAFQNLKTLWLSQNELSDFNTTKPDITFSSITTLILENNHMSSLSALPSIFAHFPFLIHLSLQSNAITTLDTPSQHIFPTLTTLNLASNLIASFTFIDALPSILPSLTSLHISKNPIYSSPTSTTQSTDSTYYLTLARIPSLTTLNYTTITPRDREEGEIYYLSVTEKAIVQVLSSSGLDAATTCTEANYPRYTSLCAKYERESVLLSPPPTTAAEPGYRRNSLASRIVHCTFYISITNSSTPGTPADRLTWLRPVPKTISVYSLKSMIHRHFGLRPLQFKLIYESPELDPIPETTRKMYSTREDWERWGDFDVDIPPPGTPRKPQEEEGREGAEKWIDGVLYKDGAKWKRRETEIVNGFRGWGEYLDGGEREAEIRIEPKDVDWERYMQRWTKEGKR